MDIFSPSKTRSDSDNTYARLYQEVKRLVNLEIENARLLVTEKLTLLLGRVTLVAVSFVLCTCALIFLSMSLSDWLLRDLEPCWTYLIVGGLYIFLAIVCFLFRRRLIIDPIARYVSRVILDPPTGKTQSVSTQNNTPSASAPINEK